VALCQRPADHHLDQALLAGLGHRHCRDPSTVAQDGHALPNHRHFHQTVRDVDDGHAVLAQAEDDLKQAGPFGIGES
jgi:hypothetical protein